MGLVEAELRLESLEQRVRRLDEGMRVHALAIERLEKAHKAGTVMDDAIRVDLRRMGNDVAELQDRLLDKEWPAGTPSEVMQENEALRAELEATRTKLGKAQQDLAHAQNELLASTDVAKLRKVQEAWAAESAQADALRAEIKELKAKLAREHERLVLVAQALGVEASWGDED